MRQFTYFYSSYIENKHGFFTFIPHANLFHPFFGLGDIGYKLGLYPYRDIIEWFWNNPLTFKHKVKLFFPEIREGVLYIDKVKYSINANEKDEADFSYRIIKKSPYLDYVEIKDHLADFEIEIELKTKYTGIWYPITISCDYIDILLFNQRISITETQGSVKAIPYLSAHHTDTPLYYLTYDNKAVVHMRNTTLTYNIVLPKESADELKKYNVQTTEVLSMFNPLDGGKKLYLLQIDAYSINYAPEKYSETKGIMPMINDMWFLSGDGHCKMQAKSWWYTTVYDKNWCSIDLPPADKCEPHCPYTADQTRGYVWFTIYNHYDRDEKELDQLAKEKLPYIAMMLYEGYAKYYTKDGKWLA